MISHLTDGDDAEREIPGELRIERDVWPSSGMGIRVAEVETEEEATRWS